MDFVIGVLFSVMGISLLLDLCFAYLFLKTTELREGPGQLILAQTQAQVILDLHWLTLDVVWSDPHPTACQIVAFFIYSGFVVSCAYSAAICVAVSQHFEKKEYPSLWVYHVIVLALSLGLCVIMAVTHGLGDSAFKDCSLRKGSWTELSELPIICVAAIISALASIRFIHNFHLSRNFTWNTLLVAMVYLALWTPTATLHFISYQHFGVKLPEVVFRVRNKQIADLIAATSTIASIGICLSYKPIRTALLMNRAVAREYAALQAINPQ